MSAPADTVIHRVDSEAVRPLRHIVLRAGKPFETTRFPGDDAAETMHFGAFASDAMVGAASLYHEAPQAELLDAAGLLHAPDFTADARLYWRLRGMAVLPEWRGRHIGSQLLLAIEETLGAHGAAILWFNARSDALGFYTRCGYTVLGREFEVPGIGPHYLALKQL